MALKEYKYSSLSWDRKKGGNVSRTFRKGDGIYVDY